MNAGLADATHLAWLLAARVQGWADESILDAYEAKRQPITQQVSNFAMDHVAKMIRARGAVPPNIEADDEAGAAERVRVGSEAYKLNVQQCCCEGLNFGYHYSDSTLIIEDEEAQPAHTMGSFTASTVPGCRMPHFWLADGRSVFDALGPGYTLLRRDAKVDVTALLRAADEHGMPLLLLDAALRDGWPKPYRHALLLVRNDTHVVWRGDVLPVGMDELVNRLRDVPVTALLPA